jgi:hypothetical protein
MNFFGKKESAVSVIQDVPAENMEGAEEITREKAIGMLNKDKKLLVRFLEEGDDKVGYAITDVSQEVIDRLEKERKGESFPDVASYIMAKKEIVLPYGGLNKQELTWDLQGEYKGSFFLDDQEKFFYYVDREGNFARFEVPAPEDIASVNCSIGEETRFKRTAVGCIRGEMVKIPGFNERSSIREVALASIEKYKRKAAADEEQKVITEGKNNFKF